MRKREIFLMNAFLSALIGAAVEVTAVYVKDEKAVLYHELIRSMLIGVCIGTTALAVFMLIILKFRCKPRVGYLMSFFTVGGLFLGGSGFRFIYSGQPFDLRSLAGLGVAEVLCLLLMRSWYKRFHSLNQLLERKRESLMGK